MSISKLMGRDKIDVCLTLPKSKKTFLKIGMIQLIQGHKE
jgi:hypothetical protein